MAKVAASLLIAGLGSISAVAVVGAGTTDEPIPTGQPATVWRTVTETRTVSLLQFLGSTWRSTPFGGYSMFDPVAQALAGGWMVSHGRSNERSCGL